MSRCNTGRVFVVSVRGDLWTKVVVSLVLTVVGGSWESRRRCPVPLTAVERITNRHSTAVVDHAIDLTTSLISKGVAVHMQVVLYQKDTTTQAIFMRVFLPFPPLTSRDRGAAERGPRLVFAAVQWTFVAALMVRLC